MCKVGVSDYELRRYQKQIGAEEYRRQYQTLYQQAKYKKRYSGKIYENSPDFLDDEGNQTTDPCFYDDVIGDEIDLSEVYAWKEIVLPKEIKEK